jgi:uncharacterized membrane protein YeaQ/YmgE (transglycosylase-associated protein family)
MNNDPKPKTFPPFTAWALIGPVLVFGLGVIIGLTGMRSSDSDWFGIAAFARIFLALVAASITAVGCSILAFVRKERTALASLITAIPGALILLVALYFMAASAVKILFGVVVAPHGKGTHTDILFTAQDNRRAADNFDYNLAVSFPNKGDGIQSFEPSPFRPNEGSELRSPHEAPEGGYEPQWVKAQSQRPGEPSQYGLDDKLNFFFRVRTELDEHGNVKSALYGKIYGDFMHFCYYLNPTSNDRSMEFDPSRNLLVGLRGSQIVDAP